MIALTVNTASFARGLAVARQRLDRLMSAIATTTTTKQCTACGQAKPIDCFGRYTARSGKRAIRARCYQCAAEDARLRAAGMTAEERQRINAKARQRYAQRPLSSRRAVWRKKCRRHNATKPPSRINTAMARRMEQLKRVTAGYPVIVTLDPHGQFDRELFDQLITDVGRNWGDLAIQCHQYATRCVRRRFANNPGRQDDALDALFMYAVSLLGNDVAWFRQGKPSEQFCRYVGAAAKRLAQKMSHETTLPLDINGAVELPENN